MVSAIIAGRKSQTRRPVKVQKDRYFGCELAPCELAGEVNAGNYANSPYDIGDLLWVRETYCLEHDVEGGSPPHNDGRPIRQSVDPDEPAWVQPHYRATDPAPELAYEYGACRLCEQGEPHAHWKPSIHMPRWASRITLRITDVRVERLQDITAADVAAEGVQIPVDASTGRPMLDISSPCAPCHYLTADKARTFDHDAWLRAHFASLWDGIYAKRGHGWASNNFVWVIGFEGRP
jgi:hypothetical protein